MENDVLKRRVEQMAKEIESLSACHNRGMKPRDFSECGNRLQCECNALLLENAPGMIFVIDKEMRFRLGTKAFMHFLGQNDWKALDDVIFDECFAGVMPPEWIESTRSLLESVIKEKKQLQYNEDVVVGGERRFFTISVTPAGASCGKIMGAICRMHDSTELVDMKETAEAATRAKSSFLASMSHEIRTPMNAIKGFSDLMTRTPLSNHQRAYVNNIVSATASLLQIINDILDFSKIEAGKYEIVNAGYDTASELEELCSLMQPKADEKGIYFAADIDPCIPAVLIGDNLRIRQILLNIINNAIKFTHKGGVVFSVSGEHTGGGEWLLTYKIRDSGQGIKAADLSVIFQAFEQADLHKNRDISGTGLGLAISKNLAELMGGDITVSSEYGAGSEFTVQIPQKAAVGKCVACIENPEEKYVLLYDRDCEAAPFMRRSLEKLGIRYRIISDKNELRVAAREETPSHIIIDRDVEFAREITEECSRVRVACLCSISFLSSDMPNDVNILFKPLLATGLAGFVRDDADARRNKSAAADADKLGAMSFPGAKVLIVDDNEINLVVASEIIKTYGIEPDTVISGAEAVEKVKGEEYDLIFMDHMMPGMDGIETTAAIRALDIRQPVVIALTANAMLGMEEIYRESGFDGYVTKPIDVDNLNSVLSGALAGAFPLRNMR